jgi:hypothetical protein
VWLRFAIGGITLELEQHDQLGAQNDATQRAQVFGRVLAFDTTERKRK